MLKWLINIGASILHQDQLSLNSPSNYCSGHRNQDAIQSLLFLSGLIYFFTKLLAQSGYGANQNAFLISDLPMMDWMRMHFTKDKLKPLALSSFASFDFDRKHLPLQVLDRKPSSLSSINLVLLVLLHFHPSQPPSPSSESTSSPPSLSTPPLLSPLSL